MATNIAAKTSSAPAKAFPDWLLGVSFAADWTWAVSVLVGMALLREQGILPFFTWFAANTAAIPAFGYVRRKYPALWNQTRRLPMRMIMSLMLMFTFWINLTGIVTMGDTLHWLSHSTNVAIALATGLALWAVTRKWGIQWSVLSDRVQRWALYGAVIVALVITLAQHGLHVDATLKWGSYTNFHDWLLGFWTVPLLLTNPFIDGSFWQRAKYAPSMRPDWWGFAMFFSYLCFVAALAFLYVVVYFAATSTMDSALSGMQLTAGRRMGIVVGLLCIGLWYTVSSVGLLSLWAVMFSWYPLMFACLVLTYHLEKRRLLKPVSTATLTARDGVPLIIMGHRVEEEGG
ncbi:MAG: hypothetical protein V1724_08280 [Chloroflexota bacterium]